MDEVQSCISSYSYYCQLALFCSVTVLDYTLVWVKKNATTEKGIPTIPDP